MAFLVVFGGLWVVVFTLAAVLQRLGWLEDPPCECEACVRARRRDLSRAY